MSLNMWRRLHLDDTHIKKSKSYVWVLDSHTVLKMTICFMKMIESSADETGYSMFYTALKHDIRLSI